jgi:hypothetical protein
MSRCREIDPLVLGLKDVTSDRDTFPEINIG